MRRPLSFSGLLRGPGMCAALVVSMTVGGCTFVGPTPEATPSAAPTASAERPPGDVLSIPELVDAVEPSVVAIFTQGGLGSGVVYREDGLILTNEHVVRGATQVDVAFADGQRVPGTVIATDPISDLALVRSDRTGLPPAQFATALPEVGEAVVVIGSPLGFENTVTSGIISGLHRQIPGSAPRSQSLVDLIQTDAAISPGNSGGAVVNLHGEVIGISEAYIPPQAGAVSLGFAIPAATATEVAEELLEDGTADHAFLGLGPRAITPEIAEQLGLERAEGVAVLSVVPDGPADEAGLRPGDVLTTLNGNALRTPEDLLASLRRHDPGDEVTLEFLRGDERSTTRATLSSRPE